jgi:hypothetical protein
MSKLNNKENSMSNIKSNQDGYVGAIIVLVIVLGLIFSAFFVRFKFSNEVVSGIAYNTTNDRFISGATCFGVRASEATYVNEETKSSYCLPPNSPYKGLVNKAAKDKRVKIEVEARKHFTVKLPWTVVPNVTVKEVQQ